MTSAMSVIFYLGVSMMWSPALAKKVVFTDVVLPDGEFIKANATTGLIDGWDESRRQMITMNEDFEVVDGQNLGAYKAPGVADSANSPGTNVKENVSDASSVLNSSVISTDIHRHGSDRTTLKLDLSDFDVKEKNDLSTKQGMNDTDVKVHDHGIVQNAGPGLGDLLSSMGGDKGISVYEFEPQKTGIPVFDCNDLCALPSQGTVLYWENGWYPVEKLDITSLNVTFPPPAGKKGMKWRPHPGTTCDATNWKKRGIRNIQLHPKSNATLARSQDDDVKLRCDCLSKSECDGSVIFAGRHKSDQEGSGPRERFFRTGSVKGVVLSKFFFKVCVWRTYTSVANGGSGEGFCDQSFGSVQQELKHNRNVCDANQVPACGKPITAPGPDCVNPPNARCAPEPSSCGHGVQNNPCETQSYSSSA